MVSLNARLGMYAASLLIAGLALFSLYDGMGDTNPNQVLAVLLFAAAVPLTLIVSAVRILIRKRAITEVSTGTDYAGTAVIHKYKVFEVEGADAVHVGIRRLIFPILVLIVLLVVLILKSDWTEPLRLTAIQIERGSMS